MSQILVLARRETKRLRSRFQGGSRWTVLVLLVAALTISYLVAQRGLVPSSGLYRIGVSDNAPPIRDSRFAVIQVEPSTGRDLLNQGAIQIYVDGQTVLSGPTRKAAFATGALEEYLERWELTRLINEEDLDRAFPLRIQVQRITTTHPSLVRGRGLSELPGVAGEPERVQGEKQVEPGHEEESGFSLTGELAPSPSDPAEGAVREQIARLRGKGHLPEVNLGHPAGDETLVPSLMEPPIPFVQVIVAFFYVLPVSFVSVFFTSSFMDEKLRRRISVLLSAPVTPLQIILGKMLPYVTFSVLSVVAITLFMRGSVLLSLVIFCPVILFVFAIYLMVPLVYRTFRDTTFISMLATTAIISYLVFPAMFSGVNDLAYMSPLTLAVKMYRSEPFGIQEYLFSTAPMILVFALSLYVGTRVLNEEFLMGFRPLHKKIREAIQLSLWPDRPYLSVALLSASLVPIVYAVELVMLAISLNLPLRQAIGTLLIAAIVVEEIAKSIGIVVLLDNDVVSGWVKTLGLSFVSAAGFLAAEKLLLLLSLRVVSDSALSTALFDSGMLLIPLAAHFLFTAIICILKARTQIRYRYALLAGSVFHLVYNVIILQGVA